MQLLQRRGNYSPLQRGGDKRKTWVRTEEWWRSLIYRSMLVSIWMMANVMGYSNSDVSSHSAARHRLHRTHSEKKCRDWTIVDIQVHHLLYIYIKKKMKQEKKHFQWCWTKCISQNVLSWISMECHFNSQCFVFSLCEFVTVA